MNLRPSLTTVIFLSLSCSAMAAAEKPLFNNCYKAELTYNSSDPALFKSLEPDEQFENMLDSSQPIQVIFQRDKCSATPIMPINPAASATENFAHAEDGDVRKISQTRDDILYDFKQVYEQGKWRTIATSRVVVSADVVGK